MKRANKSDKKIDVREIPAADVIAATGIQLMVWAEALGWGELNSEAHDVENIAYDMMMHSAVLANFVDAYPIILKKMRVRLPDSIGVEVIDNPLYEPHPDDTPEDEETPPDKQSGESSDVFGETLS